MWAHIQMSRVENNIRHARYRNKKGSLFLVSPQVRDTSLGVLQNTSGPPGNHRKR